MMCGNKEKLEVENQILYRVLATIKNPSRGSKPSEGYAFAIFNRLIILF